MRTQSAIALTILATLLCSLSLNRSFAATPSPSPSASPARTIRIEAVLKDGKKYWLPSKITAKKEERIHLKLENHIPGPNSIHGFRLPAFHIEELVDNKGKDVEFTADQVGKFNFDCHLHPTHIGGELTVREK